VDINYTRGCGGFGFKLSHPEKLHLVMKNCFVHNQMKDATVDIHRDTRCGFPEVIFCQGKTPEQIKQIAKTILAHSNRLLATRADQKAYRAIKSIAKKAVYNKQARTVTVEKNEKKKDERRKGFILIVTAGTADIPVAEEARVTAEVMGNNVKTLYDVGVAGIHRILAHSDLLKKAKVVVVVAGMEGALASVVGGLVDKPVIAVPTSVGYGAHFGGIAPLLTMLNSCAAGVAVVNIDNGFGAGYLASLINKI
jgi:NCAIR mutase (PurE)-related protein